MPLTRTEIESTGWEQVGGRHSSQYMYRGNLAFFHSEFGSLCLDGTKVYIKSLSDLQKINRLIDGPLRNVKSYHDTHKHLE